MGWLAPHPGRFTPGKDPVPIVQEAGWAPRPVWTGAENLAYTGIRSPDRPAVTSRCIGWDIPAAPSQQTQAQKILVAMATLFIC
jgi:hypothetical protein